MTEIKSISEAFDYVNQRYVFNTENYPVMDKLNKNEQKFFALKHGLLHIYKNLPSFIGVIQANMNNANLVAETVNVYKTSITKMLVNFLKLLEVADLKANEVANWYSGQNPKEIGFDLNTIFIHLSNISADCESFDHRHSNGFDKDFDSGYLEQETKAMLAILLAEINFHNTSVSFDEILNNIPVVMKSK